MFKIAKVGVSVYSIRRVFVFLIMLTLAFISRAESCAGASQPSGNSCTLVRVENSTFRKLQPQFFGFNLELVEFQNSLWNSLNQRVEPAVVEYLRRFPGAVYRYPGGTVANNFDWRAAIGPVSSRLEQKIVDWQAAKIIQFGPVEYLNFVKEVNGTAWYVVNLHGDIVAARKLDSLIGSASQLAMFMSSQRSNGMPSIYRWELGNELDRGHYRWSASKYISISKEIAEAIRRNYVGAKIVGMTQDWEHTGASVHGVNYNTTVATDLKGYVGEYAGHAYYDGKPWGPAVNRVVRQLGKNLDEVRLGAPNSVLWVTEHGRAPLGTPSDRTWRSNWPQTADLGAALSVADMMISLARTKYIEGAFIHSLHGTSGPWPMFHKQMDGTLRPSAAFWALLLLREGLLEDVLKAESRVSDNGKNSADFDSNSIVLSDAARTRFSIWIVNRNSNKLVSGYEIPMLAGKRIVLKFAHLTGSGATDSNYINPHKVFPLREEVLINVGVTGKFQLEIPGNSVYVANIVPL